MVCVGDLDSIAIARSLYASSAVRATVVQRASDQSFRSTPADPTKCAEEAVNLLESTGIPLGLSRPNPDDGIWGWPLKVLGLLISVRAAVLGAPFWNRLLDRDWLATQHRAPTRTWLLAGHSRRGPDV